MILVSGTGRCGTSMWMQALAAAGFPIVGDAFPRDWESRIGAANPRGFYESTLVDGINFTTNPDPRTGARLVPADTRDVVAKVFLHGVRRTDRPFLDHVLVSVRDWRAVVGSLARLSAIEQAASDAPLPPPDPAATAAAWFSEHAAAIEDALRRGYAVRFFAYEDALADPAGTLGAAFAWLGRTEGLAAAVAAVEPALRTQVAPQPVALPDGWADAFDALYARMRDGTVWEPAFVHALLDARRTLTERD